MPQAIQTRLIELSSGFFYSSFPFRFFIRQCLRSYPMIAPSLPC
jgi:hypothetical protein